MPNVKVFKIKDKNGEVYEFAGGGSGAVWESDEPTVTAVGGLKAGTNLQGKTATEIIDLMVNPYMSPAINIAISPNTTLYEVGATATINVTATLTKKTEEITGARILKDNADLKVANEGEITAKSFTQNSVSVQTDTTFSSKVSDSQGEVNGNSISVRFTRRSYYGMIGASDNVTSDTEIEALNSNQLTGSKGLTWNNINSANQKIAYAYPKSFGNLTSIKDSSNIDFIDSFARSEVTRDGVAYNVYVLKDPMSISNYKLTFA